MVERLWAPWRLSYVRSGEIVSHPSTIESGKSASTPLPESVSKGEPASEAAGDSVPGIGGLNNNADVAGPEATASRASNHEPAVVKDPASSSGISAESASKAGKRNFILFADTDNHDRQNLVVLRTQYSIVILNRYPYNNGHLLIAPRRQVAELEEMTESELLDAQLVMRRLIVAMRSFMRPDGFNVGLNLGRSAGAGLPEHLHWHVVPRWAGDTNFMTLMSDIRVIVQALDELWLQLREALGEPTS